VDRTGSPVDFKKSPNSAETSLLLRKAPPPAVFGFWHFPLFSEIWPPAFSINPFFLLSQRQDK
jgi:hypothetical protein